MEGFFFITAAVLVFVLLGLLLTFMILWAQKKLVRSTPSQIRINEDPSLTKQVASGQTLLSALLDEGIPIPSPCGGKATCRQCRLQILEGVEEPLETDKGTFTKRQLQEGWRLSCQLKVKQDLHIHLPEHYLTVKAWQATVLSNENVATFIKELVLLLPEGEEIPYRSGGYLQFSVPPFKTHTETWKETMDSRYHADWERWGLFGKEIDYHHLAEGEVIRAYSLASYPAEGRVLKFTIRIATPPFVQGELVTHIPWGICSSYLFSLRKGERVSLSGPYGESFMISSRAPLIFLIGGAGASFGRSHLLHLFHTEKTKREVDLWYGARALKENIYQKEYEALAQAYANFRYHLVLSEPSPEDVAAGWPKEDPLKTNYLFRAFEQGQLQKMEAPEEAFYYVCGPPLHNTSVLELLARYGIPRDQIVLDDFGS